MESLVSPLLMQQLAFSPIAHCLMGFGFLLGYLAIIFEHPLRVNKAATALLTASALWVLYFALSPFSQESNLEALGHQLQSISEIVFFLMAAMSIVEVIDAHDGFKVISDLARPMSKRTFCFAVGLLTFFMSSILDNLTTTLVMVTLLRRFITDREDRLLVGGLVVIAANAGGAWTPIGDVTTTMLWIRGNITSWQTMKTLFVPSFAAFLVAVAWLSYGMKGSFTKPITNFGEKLEAADVGGKWILLLGTLIFVLVPVFKMWTHLPAYMGLLVGLALLWVITDRMHSGKERPTLHVQHALSRIDSSSLLFFLGILLAIGALEHSLLLRATASSLDQWIGSKWIIASLIGVVSAIVDNVPLVAATMSMYSIADFAPDHPLWQWIAYCAGTGGSILIIGSAAGIAFMGLEKVSFIWYAKRIGVCALVSYIVGIGCLALMGILP